MGKEQYLEEYDFLSLEQLEEEKAKQEQIIQEQTEIWKTTSLAGAITMTFFGIVFCWIIVGIPLLVIGIKSIVNKSRTRNRANIAIWHAKDRVSVLDSLILKKKKETGAEKAIEPEVIG